MLTLILVSQLFGVSGTNLLPKFCFVLPTEITPLGFRTYYMEIMVLGFKNLSFHFVL